MESQKKLIHERDWDNLIVLDGCRYDYFEKIYRDYLDGELKRVISPGSCTTEWLRGTFGNKEFDEIIYVSANPYINSKGVNVVKGFNGREHFNIVIDVWDWGWDEILKTVPPKYVSKATRIAKAKHPGKRLISHFMQPHYPYLSLGPLRGGFSRSIAHAKEGKAKESESLVKMIRRFTGRIAIELLGWMRVYRIRHAINLAQPEETEMVAQKYGVNGLRNAYEKNLKIVLEEAAELVECLPGKSVITTDHGEFLSEDNLYGHPCGYNHPLLKEVPWLEV